jgi:beta-N-acetylhexosaminidase
MTAHIVVPSLDPTGEPATLSAPILTGILREEMGFDGVVITDALNMDALRIKHAPERIPVLALKAGVDQLLMPVDGEMDLNVQAVLDAVASGELTEERIDESVERVLRLKWRRGIVADPFVDVEDAAEVVGTPTNAAIAQKITDRTITALRNEDSSGAAILPTTVDGAKVLVAGANGTSITRLASSLQAKGATVTTLSTGTRPTDANVAAAVSAASGTDHVVVVTSRAANAVTDPGRRQALLVDRLAATGVPVTAVAVNDAYDVAVLPENVAFLASYSTTAPSMESVATIISGEIGPAGRLPVEVPGTDGSTLYPHGAGLRW